MAAVFALAAQAVKSLFAVDGGNAAAFDVIVTAIQHPANLHKLCEVSGHRVLEELIRNTARRRSKLLKAGFGCGLGTRPRSSERELDIAIVPRAADRLILAKRAGPCSFHRGALTVEIHRSFVTAVIAGEFYFPCSGGFALIRYGFRFGRNHFYVG